MQPFFRQFNLCLLLALFQLSFEFYILPCFSFHVSYFYIYAYLETEESLSISLVTFSAYTIVMVDLYFVCNFMLCFYSCAVFSTVPYCCNGSLGLEFTQVF